MWERDRHAFQIPLVIVLVMGLITVPFMPDIVSAEQKSAVSQRSVEQNTTISSRMYAGVGVSGSPDERPRRGTGVLAPPPRKTDPPAEKPPEEGAEQEEMPKGIGASAVPVGPAIADAGDGISMGWKIAGGVLGLGLLLGLAGGGGGGGGGTTGGH